MKVGDLVRVPCTCGMSHDEEPLTAVIIGIPKDSDLVQVLLKGRKVTMLLEELTGDTDS